MFSQNPSPQNIYRLKKSPALIGLTLSAPARDGKGEQFTPTTYLYLPERIYNPITAKWFSAMFTFQLDNTKR